MFGVSPIVPAYGRDYKSIKAVTADFEAGKDFKTPMGQACNINDLRAQGLTTIQVRYGNSRKTTMLTIKEK